jgi:hypothetical protein
MRFGGMWRPSFAGKRSHHKTAIPGEPSSPQHEMRGPLGPMTFTHTGFFLALTTSSAIC